MPKIAADSVHEHVARQKAAVIAAAIKLFNERGVRDVTLADIANEVGLARNSLYRYFPDTAHILAAWFRVTIGPLVELSNRIATSGDTAGDRLAQWIDAQFDYLTAPDHAAMLMASNEMTAMPDDVRAELGAGHRELYGSLAQILRDALGDQPERDLETVTMLTAATVRSAAELTRARTDPVIVRAELRRAVVAFAGL